MTASPPRVTKWLGRWSAYHALRVLLVAVAVTIVAGALAGRLRLVTDFSALLPEDHESVRALRELQARVGGESRLAVVIEGPSFDANRRFAEALIPRALELTRAGTDTPLFPAVEYLRDVEFLANHALYFATDDELDRIEEELRHGIARARLADRRTLRNLLRAEAVRPDDSASGALEELRDILPSRYPISPDSGVLVLRLSVSGSQSDIGFLRDAMRAIDRSVTALDPSSFHPELQVSYGDRVARQLIEVETILSDVRVSLLVGAGAVWLVVFLYFGWRRRRSAVGAARAAVVIVVPLVMSLVWTFGFASLVFGALNLFTATLGLVLFGLGIDYGVHFYARYIEARDRGLTRADAIVDTLGGIGGAIAASAATTAVPLLVLVTADFRGFSEFGVIGGVGVLFAALAMVTVLPALVSVLPERAETGGAPPDPDLARRGPGWRRSVVIVLAGAGLLATAPWTVPALEFEYDFSSLEPRYPAYDAVNQKFRAVFPRRGSPPAYVLTESAEQSETVAALLRRRVAADHASPTVERVETLGDRFPLEADAARRKLDRLDTIRTLAAHPGLEGREDPDLDALRRAASTRSPISRDSLPAVVTRAFAGRGDALGEFLMVYPSVALSDGRQSMAFAEDVGVIPTDDGRVYHGVSTSIVAASMLRTMLTESPRMILVSLASIGLLMLVAFRSGRWALLALVPLAVGAAGVAAIAGGFGLHLNFYNLAAIPAVLGIGNDCGVHLTHRYRQEGRGSTGLVLRHAGEPVAIGGLTTMVAFSGLLLTTHPGLTSIGQLATVGVGTILLVTLVLQPAVFRCLEGR